MAGHVFTDDEIKQIIDVINTTKHTQYIGQRYVPILGRKGEDTIEWDDTAPYEPLTIVLYKGNSYTSRQYVPTGADINDGQYWANTGNYNAQVEQYRQDCVHATRRADEAYEHADEAYNLADDTKNNLAAIGVHDVPSATAFKKALDDTASLAHTNETAIASIGADVAAISARIDRANVFNFLDYAAKGGDDDERLDYILALPNSAGRALYFPAGDYHFKREHELPDRFAIYGEGASTRLIREDVPDDTDGLGTCLFKISTTKSGYELCDFTFESPTAMPSADAPDTKRHNIYMLKIAQKGITDVYAHDIDCASYSLMMCGLPHVDSTDGDRNARITVARCTAGAWTNNNTKKHDITTAVVEIYNTDDWRVTGCRFNNKNYWGGGCGIQCWGGSSIDEETFRGGGKWMHRFAIDNNIVRHTQWSPIYTACAADGYIVNNVCEDCSDGCMSIEGARNVVISGNVLRDSNNYCAALANAMDNVVFSGNVLTQSGGAARLGDQNKPGQVQHRRYRFINRWGLRVNEDTSLHQSLVVAGNVFRYDGDTTVATDGQCCGVIELGVDCGTLSFADNHLTNVMLSTFTKPVTGDWGIASSYQLAFLRPGRVRIRGNSFVFDDADARVAQEGAPFQNACIYVSPSFGQPVVIENNEIKSIDYAEKAVPITMRNIYVSRTSGGEHYELDTKANKSLFVVRDNVFSRFDRILNAKSDSGINSLDVILQNNLYQTSDEWQIVKGGGYGTNIFFDNNRKQLYDKETGELSYVEPLVMHLPPKGSDLYKMTAIGTDFTFPGAQTLGGKQYHTITRVTDGWRGCGEVGPVVSEW